jgi:hypothetical protein
MTFCSTCGLKNPEREAPSERRRNKPRPYIKAGEAITITYPEYVRDFAPNLSAPGSAVIALSLFLYLFRAENPLYLILCVGGFILVFAGWLVGRTGDCSFVISPSTRSIRQKLSCAGFSIGRRVMGFDDITSIRLEGERRYKGAMKGVPSYYYVAYWIVVIDAQGRHRRLSSAIRTDKDPDFTDGPDYEYGGLLPLAQKAGAVVGVDVYVAPQVAAHRLVTNIWKLALLAAILVVAWLLL